MLWLFGDSIFHGYAGPIAEKDLSPPAEMLNAAFGEERARVGGPTMIPERVEKAAGQISAFQTLPGDAIIMLDAGHHSCDPDAHQRQWELLIRAAQSSCKRVIVCDAPDNMAEQNWLRKKPKPHFWHALRFGERSHNDAVHAAVQTCGAELLEVAAPMHAFHQVGPGAYLPDNIHLNRLGQAYLCKIIAKRVWPGDEWALANLDALSKR